MAPGLVAPAHEFSNFTSHHGLVKNAVKIEAIDLPVQVPDQTAYHYTVKEEPLHTRRPFRTVCLGGGYSGLMMAIVASEKMQDPANEFVIYEKNHDIGGTWLENRSVYLQSTAMVKR